MITISFEELPLQFDGQLLDCMFKGEADLEQDYAGAAVVAIRIPTVKGGTVEMQRGSNSVYASAFWQGLCEALESEYRHIIREAFEQEREDRKAEAADRRW